MVRTWIVFRCGTWTITHNANRSTTPLFMRIPVSWLTGSFDLVVSQRTTQEDWVLTLLFCTLDHSSYSHPALIPTPSTYSYSFPLRTNVFSRILGGGMPSNRRSEQFVSHFRVEGSRPNYLYKLIGSIQ